MGDGSIQRRREELAAELKELERKEESARERRRNAVKPDRRFTIARAKREGDYFDRILDPAVIMYRIEGIVVNKEAAEAAGWGDRDTSTGGMNYLFNTATGRIIMASGGGNIYISDGSWYGKNRAQEAADGKRVYAELEAFLKEHPEGGDITDIIRSQRSKTW